MMRLFYTLYYHRPEQLWRRFQKRFVSRFVPTRPATVAADCRVRSGQGELFRDLLCRRVAGRRASIRQDGDAVRRGQLTFLGQTVDLADPDAIGLSFLAPRSLDPHAADVDHLWRFHLHYQEFLFDLISHDGIVDLGSSGEEAWSVVNTWIERFPLADRANVDDAWHPFCISRRLPVWMMLWHHAEPPEDSQELIRESIYRQADYLANHLELDLGGNHLLENLRTLAIAAVFLDATRASDWLQTVQRLLRRELPLQCLDSGEHFELTPTYHAIVLELLLEIRDVLKQSRPDVSTFVEPYVASMQRFLAAICHPDGDIPLFSDSAFGPAPCASELLSGVEAKADFDPKGNAAIVGGYWTWRNNVGDALIFDRGQAAADHLPAHAHCDLLNLEASVAGERLIVDAGVFDYGDTEMRKYCRGTSAHNVLQIDDVDQCDVWSRFRMGYRGRVVETSEGEEPCCSWSQARHDAYRRLGVSVVNRWLACHESGAWICVDWADAARSHRFANRVRIHPNFQVEQIGPREFLLRSAKQELQLTWLFDSGTVAIESGWYCPEFGQRLPISVITWREQASTCRSAWQLSKPGVRVLTLQMDAQPGDTTVSNGGRHPFTLL